MRTPLTPNNRHTLMDYIRTAPDGWVFELSEPKRTEPQNNHIHPVVRAIQKHMEAHGAKKRSEDWWRYYLLGKFAGNEVCEDPDGSGGIVVMNREAGTSGMNKARANEFIEWMYAFGTSIGVRFPAPKSMEAA